MVNVRFFQACFVLLSGVLASGVSASQLDLGSAENRFMQSEMVIVGTVTRVSAKDKMATIRVEATIKGEVVKQVEFSEHPIVLELARNLGSNKGDVGCMCFRRGRSFVFMLVKSKLTGRFHPTSPSASVILLKR
jgi:hypothetical protein